MAVTDNTQTSSAAVDVVAVLDADLNQLFPEARPIKATVREEAKAMEHPLETGSVVVDHRILLPVEIELTCVLSSAEYADVFQRVKTVYRDGSLCTVQTRVDSYDSMLIVGMPHEEAPEMQDGVTLILQLRHVLFVDAQFRDLPRSKVAPRNPKNSNTAQRGEQRPAETPEPRKGSILSRMGRRVFQ